MLQPPDGDRRTTNDYSLVQEAIRILEQRDSARPVCIFLATFNPHPPYSAPADFHHLYSAAALPPLIPPGGAHRPNFHRAIRAAYGLDRLSDASLRAVRAVYYGQVSYADWLLGELLAAMERTGRDEDTALIVFSDHGDYAGDYGLVEKWPSGLEDCLTHVPMIVRIPRRRAGHRRHGDGRGLRHRADMSRPGGSPRSAHSFLAQPAAAGDGQGRRPAAGRVHGGRLQHLRAAGVRAADRGSLWAEDAPAERASGNHNARRGRAHGERTS